MMLDKIGAASAVLNNARIEAGAAASFDSLTTLVAGAKQSLTGELFKVNDPAITAAFQERALHVPVRLLTDSQYMVDPAEFSLGRFDGIGVTGHGVSPDKLHTKFVVADGSRGMMMTAAAVQDLRNSDTADFAAHVTGAQANALQNLAEAAIAGTSKGIRSSAKDAAQLGIFVNDTSHGITLLRDRVERQINNATSSVYVATKVMDDPESVRLLKAAQDRGRDVLVEVSPKSTDADVARLRDAGIQTTDLPQEHRRLHGNLVITDMGQPNMESYMGTAMLSKRGMVRGDAARQAREIGWMTTDPKGIKTAAHSVSTLAGSQLGAFAKAHDFPLE
jgi:hypothetical protein